MTVNEKLLNLKERADWNARECIFPFWTSEYILDEENGGFYGKVTRDMEIVKDEPRSLVLTGRMVYAFSNAWMLYRDEIYLDRAKRAFDYLEKYFYDPVYGGAYSTVSYKGEVIDDNKPTYAESFLIMAAAAYYHATRDQRAYEIALESFRIMEEKVKIAPGVYRNGFTRDWSKPAEMRFGSGRRAVSMPDGIMFQHHLCQAYEQLYRATNDPIVGKALREFSEYICETLYDPEYRCFKGFMDKEGNRLGTRQSFGHDCEISYLAMDIAELVGDDELISKTKDVCKAVLKQVLENDFDSYGSLFNGGDLATGQREESRVWWAQAEAVTAMLCGYELTGDTAYLDACMKQLEYIEKYFVDRKDGDWFNNVIVDEQGWRIVDGMHGFDKLNAGKCPFHNSHMCFEVIRRVDRILSNQKV